MEEYFEVCSSYDTHGICQILTFRFSVWEKGKEGGSFLRLGKYSVLLKLLGREAIHF